MAIIRKTLQCKSCDAKVITRTAPSLFPPQEHMFACPGCGVEIRFTVNQHKSPKTGFRVSFGRPVNARWAKSEAAAVKTLSFDADRVAPKDMTNVFSPFLAESFKLSPTAHLFYAREEGLRRAWRESQWPWIQRLIVHFDKRNSRLFDKEAKIRSGSPAAQSWATRLRVLYDLLEKAFDNFTLTRRDATNRVRQRLALAESIDASLCEELRNHYVASMRAEKLWQEITKVRTAFLANYLAMAPVLRVQYWTTPLKDLSEFSVTEKRFERLKQLYVDCFETLCRLTVIALACEAIIHHRSLTIPTKKGLMTIWAYEAMPNGNKHTILSKYPIADLFVPFIDTKLRNGIGHHSAVYRPEEDDVVYYAQDHDQLRESRIAYTTFVFKVLELFSVMELAALYFHPLHVNAVQTETKTPA